MSSFLSGLTGGRGFGSFAGGLFGSTLGNVASYGGSGLGGALFGGITAKRQWKYAQKQMALQQQYALEQMTKQYEHELANSKALFDYENAYNEPVKVFDRYRQAGITPAGVLGASGVGVNATMSSSPTGFAGVSTPSAGSFLSGSLGALPAGVANPGLAIAKQEAEIRNINADTKRIQGDTHSVDWRASFDKLVLDAQEHGVNVEKYRADIMKYDAVISENNAWLSTMTVSYDRDVKQAQYGLLVEQYHHAKKENEYLARVIESQLALNGAMVEYYENSADVQSALAGLTQEEFVDARNTIQQKWNAPVTFDIYDSKGKVVGQETTTIGEMSIYLAGVEAEDSQLSRNLSKWRARSEKNAFGYDVSRGLLTALGILGAAKASRSGGKSPTPSGYEEVKDAFNSSGEFIGGTRVRRDYMP